MHLLPAKGSAPVLTVELSGLVQVCSSRLWVGCAGVLQFNTGIVAVDIAGNGQIGARGSNVGIETAQIGTGTAVGGVCDEQGISARCPGRAAAVCAVEDQSVGGRPLVGNVRPWW